MGIHYKYIDILQLGQYSNVHPWACLMYDKHTYPGQNMDTRIAEVLRDVQLIQSVISANRPWLKALLGNTAGPK